MTITQHAYDKAKERLALKKGSVNRLANKAFLVGRNRKEFSGQLGRYLDKLYNSHGTANNIRIYGHNIYIFSGDILITVYRIPNEFIKYL
jgi:hypothetical protein